MTINEIIGTIDSLRRELEWYLPIEQSVENELWDKIRLDWNYNSSNMEGIDLTFEQIQQLMLKRGVLQGKKLKDCNQVKGHDDAVSEIKSYIKEGRPFTEHFIRGLHEILLKEEYYNPAITIDGAPTQKLVIIGDYKTLPNDVNTKDGLFRFASPNETRTLMADLVKWCNSEMSRNTKHPLLISAEFHYRFVRIHPFDDGNGRMARLLSNYILMYFNYPPIIIETNQKAQYLRALRIADNGRLAELKKFFGLQLHSAIKRYIEAAKGDDIFKPGDLKNRILILTKKVENNYMKNAKSNKDMVEVLTNIYSPLIIETDKHIQDVKHLFMESSWHFFEEPKDGKIPMTPMTWNLQSILLQFVELATVSDSFHHFKVMNWLMKFRSKEQVIDVEIAFKIYFSDFDFEIRAYVGRPMESGMLMGSIKKIFESINAKFNSDLADNHFTGFEYSVYQGEYGTLPIKSDIVSWAETLGHKFVGYIEKKAGLNPDMEEKNKPKYPIFAVKK